MIALACDHGGFELMQTIKKHLTDRGLEYKDFGTTSTDSCDYPVYGAAASRAVGTGECERGILVCGTGIGMSIVANKIEGVRCALCSETFSATMTRMHNDANMLALGARVTGDGLALLIVDAFLDTQFEGGRHARRVDMINELDKR